MAEEFQGGVCSGTWWNPNLFSGGSGGVGGFSSPCSVAQLGGGYDMGSFGWPHEIMKGNKLNDHQVCDDNTLAFSADIDSTLDILGFGLSPTSSTTDWNHQNQFSKVGSNEDNYELMLLQENLSSALNYEMGANVPTLMNSASFSSQDGSSPPTTTMSNSSGDSITSDGGRGLTTSFPMSSSASYLLQTLFDDIDESQVSVPQQQQQQQQQQQAMSQLINTSDYGHELMSSPCLELPQSDMFNVNGGHQLSNGQYNTATTLSNIRASLLNSLQSRSRAPTFNQKSLNTNVSTKVKHEETRKVSKKNMNNNNNDQPAAKRPRIETPSPLPTFKVRKEKLGDRITALQQLVSPFGKTDTASVLHEAIEYIKFLHDQVHVLSTPYSKNNGAAVQHQQVSNENNEEIKQDLRSRGLCLAPIASTYPVTQETPVDFWTPTFGGTTFR